jgi:hypothetical protein
MPVPTDSRFVRSPQAKIKRVGTGIAVYVPDKKAIHVLNSTAQLLFDVLIEPTTESELRDALVIATDGDPSTIAGDVRDALADFIDKGIIMPEAE